jgi:hypothetical protein
MKNILQLVTEKKNDKKFVNYPLEDFLLRLNFFKQWNRSDAIGIDLAVTFTRPALECSDHVSKGWLISQLQWVL